MKNKVLITGSSGLIGSEAVTYFDKRGWGIIGVDNNMRSEFFGPDGDTSWNLARLLRNTRSFESHDLDIRARDLILDLVRRTRPSLIVHCAAQPSHDLAKDRPFDDFEVNALGTLNLLEAVRRFCPESPFIFMSTNKVYGDAPNEIPLIEFPTRWDYDIGDNDGGIDESCRVDMTLHSLFGASKLAADIMVQEYGRYFSMPTVCLRAGCLTGPRHSGAELHGFLAYMARCVQEDRVYRIFGYKGKQVRDNIHSEDICSFFELFWKNPRIASVYNIGGGRANSVSILEAKQRFEAISGKSLRIEYLEANRKGDHICYISNLNKITADYPSWTIQHSLEDIITDLMTSGINYNR